MLSNKILINLYILSMDENYELYIPINDKIGNIVNLLSYSLFDSIDGDKNKVLLNFDTGLSYKNNVLVRDTDIENGSRLILL